jgi:glycosyltransferase involved in cell wall biosynthesis
MGFGGPRCGVSESALAGVLPRAAPRVSEGGDLITHQRLNIMNAVSRDRVKLAMLATDAREHWREYHKTQPYFGTAPAALFDGLALLPEHVEVHVVSCIQRPMASPVKLADNMFFHPVLVRKIGWMRTGYQGCIRAVRRKLQALRPDIVHGQGTERDCAISAVFSGFPNVITIHGNMRLIARVNRARPFTFAWLAARLEGFTLPRAGGVVCISRYTEAAVRPLNDCTWVVPNAVHKDLFDVQPVADRVVRILCVGHISVRKNQVQLIRSLDALAAKRSFQVVFLGGAPREDPYCGEFFELLGTRPWCIYGGLADHSALQGHFATASLLILPSLEDNCPMAVLEAMAAGLPVSAANVGGVPELVEHGVTGLLFDPNDPESIRKTVVEVLNEPAKAKSRAESARRQALKTYHPKAVALRHCEIYRELLTAR